MQGRDSWGGIFAGFDVSAGVRQGCPLSPLLFAIAADLLLRRLQRLLPSALPRAYADDLALISANVFQDLPLLRRVFADYARISNLHLNLGKTVLTPLWPASPQEVRTTVYDAVPEWASVKIQGHGEYLGFQLGPSASDSSWDKPLKKFIDRAAAWGRTGCGFQLSALALQVYITPVLGFVSQLLPARGDWEVWLRKACSKLFPGPFRWLSTSILLDLKPLGFSGGATNLEALSLAARFRVLTFEAGGEGGLQVRQKLDDLDTALRDMVHLGNYGRWYHWFNNGFVHHLKQAQDRFAELGWRKPEVIAEISRTPDAIPTFETLKRRWQRTCYGVAFAPLGPPWIASSVDGWSAGGSTFSRGFGRRDFVLFCCGWSLWPLPEYAPRCSVPPSTDGARRAASRVPACASSAAEGKTASSTTPCARRSWSSARRSTSPTTAWTPSSCSCPPST